MRNSSFNYCSLVCNISFFSSCKIFSLSLVSSSVLLWYGWVRAWFSQSLYWLGFALLFESVNLCFSQHLGGFQLLFLHIDFSVPTSSFPSSKDSSDTNVRLLILCTGPWISLDIVNLLSLCCLYWIISIDLPSSLLTLLCHFHSIIKPLVNALLFLLHEREIQTRPEFQ